MSMPCVRQKTFLQSVSVLDGLLYLKRVLKDGLRNTHEGKTKRPHVDGVAVEHVDVCQRYFGVHPLYSIIAPLGWNLKYMEEL